jgi:anti-sigma factor RsiW
MRGLQAVLRNDALRFQPPRKLEQRLRSELRREEKPARKSTFPQWRWFLTGSLALTTLLGLLLVAGLFTRPSPDDLLAQEVVSSHVRSLMADHLTDVPSSDQHTVKPWFDGKLDFAPPVRDFSSADFPLLGGRLDVIEGRTVAALVYGRRKHFISVFVEKAAPDTSWSGSGEAQGYHWTAWNKDGFTFCGVSDVSSADLNRLKELFIQE